MYKYSLSLAFLLLNVCATVSQTTTWVIDKEHARIGFSVNHILISETSGIFRGFEGTVISKNKDFSDSKITVSLDANSIDTDSEKRDKDLRSDEFLNTNAFPKITFTSTSFKKVSGKNYKLVGDLTIKDVTKSVTFDVVYDGIVEKDRWGKTQAGFKIAGVINRFDFGVKWNHLLDNGSAVAGAMVDILITVEFTKVN